MLGFASGVMIAASFWSLLAPAIELAEHQGTPGWVPAAVGFLAGAAFLRIADAFLPHLHPGQPDHKAEGVKTNWGRTTLLVLAITLHNIPEGLAVGVAFGAAATGTGIGDIASFSGAVALALGIGLQNVPEGVAVALPIRAVGVSRLKSFGFGSLSAAVEPVAAVIGAAAVVAIGSLLPYALAFAAGAMIYVVVEELIPQAHNGRTRTDDSADIATLATIAGFVVMMVLDVALG
jgi:ZIP family zinc transporter